MVAILFISIFKGLDTLEFLEKYALIITLIIITALIFGLARYDVSVANHVTWPQANKNTLLDVLRILGGTLIVVQGFETTRYLGDEFDAKTRIKACRNS